MKNIAITENHLYNKAYTKGKRFSGRYISVYILKDYTARKIMLANPEKKYLNRLGLSVSKKIGGAVVRSRVKRILRAAFSEVRGELKTGWLIVISARGAATEVKSTDIAREMRYAFVKLGMMIPPDGEKSK